MLRKKCLFICLSIYHLHESLLWNYYAKNFTRHYIKVFIFKRVHNSVGKIGGEKSLNSPLDFSVISKYHFLLLTWGVTSKKGFLELIPDIVPLTASRGTKNASVYLCDLEKKKGKKTKTNKNLLIITP